MLAWTCQFSSVQSVSQSCLTLRPHESLHARPPCPSPTPGVHSDSCPSSQWCHPAISSSVVPFSSCPQSLPASESFPMSQLFAWGGQTTGVSASASVPPKCIYWFSDHMGRDVLWGCFSLIVSSCKWLWGEFGRVNNIKTWNNGQEYGQGSTALKLLFLYLSLAFDSLIQYCYFWVAHMNVSRVNHTRSIAQA